MPIAVPAFFAAYQSQVDETLCRLVPDGPAPFARAMAYTLQAPSKRIRPVLTLLAAELCGGDAARALPAAAVIELVHASSLTSAPAAAGSPCAWRAACARRAGCSRKTSSRR